jgi:pimeloyl-ACP methyl ester carboxylesterase
VDAAIDRAFVRIEEGLVHLRQVAGADGVRPLCMLHLSPASSLSMEPLMRSLRELGFAAPIIAPDTLGNGDSAPPAPAAPDIAYFAGSLARVLDQLGVETVDIFGSHTGGRIGCEFALAYPDRVGRLVIDGITEYSPEARAKFRTEYTPSIKPDAFGAQFNWAFNYSRNQYLFYPWFMQDAEHRLTRSVPPADVLHGAAMDILKALDTYHLAYTAAFNYPSQDRVAALACPTLLLKPETSAAALNEAADRYANGRNIKAKVVSGDDGLARAICDFLAES